MKTPADIYKKYFGNDEIKKETTINLKQNLKLNKLYDKLEATLNEEQKKILCDFDTEYFSLVELKRTESFEEGIKNGLKLAFRLLLDSIK